MRLAREIKQPHIEQLRQLCAGPVWDGKLIDKDARDWLFSKGCVCRHRGWNFVTSAGIEMCEIFGILKK